MSTSRIDEFHSKRDEGHERLLDTDHLGIKRFHKLDTDAYRDRSGDGGLDGRTKELLGLVASTVLRCDDCIAYHTERCVAMGWVDTEIEDAMNVALVVGGSITIPHLRRAKLFLEELRKENK
jgi:AhpD family alkylhydroperoxidase